MPITKKVSLNKAAVMMKRAKQKQNDSSLFANVVLYPIDAVSGKNPEQIRQQLLNKIEVAKKTARECKDAILFYAEIKGRLITANVESGLHIILCQLDMLKNMKANLELMLNYEASKAVQNAAHNSKGVSHVLLEEDYITQPIVFNNFIQDIVQEITRPDSKNNFINVIVNIPTIGEAYIKDALVTIQQAVNELEDKKYDINNTYKIVVEIPDSLAEYFGC